MDGTNRANAVKALAKAMSDSELQQALDKGIGFYTDGNVAYGAELLAAGALSGTTLKDVKVTFGIPLPKVN